MDGTQARSIDGNLSTGGRKQGLIISKKIFFIQLNEYETHPYFLQFFQSNMPVCLIIHMFCKSCKPEIFFVLICPLAEQFHVHRSYKTRESTMSCIGNFEENINLSRTHLAINVDIFLGIDAFDQIIGLFRKEEQAEEKDRLSRSLGASKDVDVLQKVLDFAMSEEIRFQDTPWVISSVSNNMKGREMAWQFVKANYSKIHDR